MPLHHLAAAPGQAVAPGHLGPLHPVEQALVLTLAFGPFVVLAVVVWWTRRRQDDDHSTGA